MGMRAFRKSQIGLESVKGTSVAATSILLGVMTVEDRPEHFRPVEERGSLHQHFRSILTANLEDLIYNADASFEQILQFLSMGIQGNITPSGTGEYTWTFTPNLTAAGTFDSFTIEFGDNDQAWEVEYVMARQLEISGRLGGPLMLKASMFGRKQSTTTFTGALTIPSLETALFQKCKLYIDAEDGTIGTTQKVGALLGFTYTINTGLGPKRRADGSLDFSGYAEDYKSAQLKMTVEVNSDMLTEKGYFDGQTKRLFRIDCEGSTISTNPKQITLDLCGTYTPPWPPFGDDQGANTWDITVDSLPGENYTKPFEVAIVNALDAMP